MNNENENRRRVFSFSFSFHVQIYWDISTNAHPSGWKYTHSYSPINWAPFFSETLHNIDKRNRCISMWRSWCRLDLFSHSEIYSIEYILIELLRLIGKCIANDGKHVVLFTIYNCKSYLHWMIEPRSASLPRPIWCARTSPHAALVRWIHGRPAGAIVGFGEFFRVRQWAQHANHSRRMHRWTQLRERVFWTHRPAPYLRVVEEK